MEESKKKIKCFTCPYHRLSTGRLTCLMGQFTPLGIKTIHRLLNGDIKCTLRNEAGRFKGFKKPPALIKDGKEVKKINLFYRAFITTSKITFLSEDEFIEAIRSHPHLIDAFLKNIIKDKFKENNDELLKAVEGLFLYKKSSTY